MKLANRALNPGFEVSTANLSVSSATLLKTSYAPMVAVGTSALQVTITGTPTTATYVGQTVTAAPGEYMAFGVNARISVPNSRYLRLRIIFRNAANTDLASTWGTTAYMSSSSAGGPRYVVTSSMAAPEGTTKAFVLVYLYNDAAASVAPVVGAVYSVDAWTIVGSTSQAQATAAVQTHFDGYTQNGGGLAYGWDGTPGLSTSYRIDSIDLVHWWTRKWWETLPNAYRMADAVQDPSVGYFPLMRWMNGVGAIAGEIRDLSDDVWDGSLTDVERMPDAALRWVAQLLGMSDAQRSVTSAELRTALRELLTSGRRAVGTRGAIAEVAKRFLTGEKQVTVVPSSTTKNTIVLLVRAAEVPAGNLVALASNVRAAGAVPAGHNLIAVNAIATWDSFMAAAGVTWDELDAKTKTWAQHDSLGVDLTGT